MRPRFFHLLFYVRLHLSFSLSLSLVGFLFSFLSLFEFLSSPVLNTILGDDIFILSDFAKITKKKTMQSKSQNNFFFPLGFDWWIFNFISFFCLGGEIFQWVSTFFFSPENCGFPSGLCFSSFSKVSDSQPHTLKYFLLFISPSFRCSFFYFIILFCFDTFLITLLALDESAVRESVWLKWIE